MAPNDIIYFDSAATSYLRPPEVAEAVAAAIRGFGSPGRGTYAPAVEASMAVHEARAAVARLLGAPSPAAISFTANATEALNVAIAALLPDGGKAVTTVWRTLKPRTPSMSATNRWAAPPPSWRICIRKRD